MNKTNRNWYPYKEVGSYYRLVNGVLLFSPMNIDGTRDSAEAEVDFPFIAVDQTKIDKNGKKSSLVEFVRSIEEELLQKE
jgi:hypothetical protein